MHARTLSGTPCSRLRERRGRWPFEDTYVCGSCRAWQTDCTLVGFEATRLGHALHARSTGSEPHRRRVHAPVGVEVAALDRIERHLAIPRRREVARRPTVIDPIGVHRAVEPKTEKPGRCGVRSHQGADLHDIRLHRSGRGAGNGGRCTSVDEHLPAHQSDEDGQQQVETFGLSMGLLLRPQPTVARSGSEESSWSSQPAQARRRGTHVLPTARAFDGAWCDVWWRMVLRLMGRAEGVERVAGRVVFGWCSTKKGRVKRPWRY